MKGGEVGNTISPQIGGRSGPAKPSATAHEGHLAAWMLRAALTISRKSPEKFKLGFKQIIRPLVKYGHVLAPAQRSALRLAANKPTKISGVTPQTAECPGFRTETTEIGLEA